VVKQVVRRLRHKSHFYIVIEERDSSFFGRWHCHHCGGAGHESVAYRSIDEAVVAAKSGTAGHAHPGRNLPNPR
jgi:hypothetical protein